MKTLYQIVGTDTGELLTREQLEEQFGPLTNMETGKHLRPELQGQPRLPKLYGPMWGGWFDADGEHVFPTDPNDPTSPPEKYSSQKPIAAVVIRYETPEAYDMLSR